MVAVAVAVAAAGTVSSAAVSLLSPGLPYLYVRLHATLQAIVVEMVLYVLN